jgi:hypothetical protein
MNCRSFAEQKKTENRKPRFTKSQTHAPLQIPDLFMKKMKIDSRLFQGICARVLVKISSGSSDVWSIDSWSVPYLTMRSVREPESCIYKVVYIFDDAIHMWIGILCKRIAYVFDDAFVRELWNPVFIGLCTYSTMWSVHKLESCIYRIVYLFDDPMRMWTGILYL